jgi:hypothetical protein
VLGVLGILGTGVRDTAQSIVAVNPSPSGVPDIGPMIEADSAPVHVYVVGPQTQAITLAEAATDVAAPDTIRMFIVDDGTDDPRDLEMRIAVAAGELMLSGVDFRIVDLRSSPGEADRE